jgi:hypothetical protein
LLLGGLVLATVPLIISTLGTKWVATEEGAHAIEVQVQQRLIAVRDMNKERTGLNRFRRLHAWGAESLLQSEIYQPLQGDKSRSDD